LPWFAATYASSLLTNNLGTTATIPYMFLYHISDLAIVYNDFTKNVLQKAIRPSLWRWKFWDGKQENPDKSDPSLDPHYKLMLEYDEVPGWWYATIMALSFTVGMICIYEAESTLPWYAYIVSILLSFVFTLFMGIQTARFGMYVGQQNLIQMIGAFINPGKPLANMYFTLYGSNSVTQALGLLSDLKLGQYMKLSPKATFTMQILGTLIGALLNFAIMETVTDNRREILLSIEGTNVWSGQVIQSYNSQVGVRAATVHLNHIIDYSGTGYCMGSPRKGTIRRWRSIPMGADGLPHRFPGSSPIILPLQIPPQQQDLQSALCHQCSHPLLVSGIPMRGHQLFGHGLLRHCAGYPVLCPQVLP
jgi:OPT family oligopeptide transporter